MAAPLLTPAQFARTPVGQKPGASYHGYVRWVTQTRAARAARAMNPMIAFTQAMKAAPGQARIDVNNQIKLGLAGDRAATKIAQDQANRQAARAQEAATSVAQIMAEDPNRIHDDWQSAAHFYGALGTGLTGAVADAQKAEAAKNELGVAQAGEPAPPRADIATPDLGAMHNVAQYGDVLLPASSMGEEANLAMAGAREQGARTVAAGQAIADQYRQRSIDAQTALTAKRAALEAQRPGLYTQALTARETAARNNLQALVNAGYISAQTRGNIGATTGIDPVTGMPTLNARIAQSKANQAMQDAAAKTAQQRIANMQARTRLRISQQQANIAQKRETAYEQNLRWHQAHPNSKGKKSGNVNGMSDAEVRQYASLAGNIAMTYFQGKKNPKFDTTKKADPKTNPLYSTKPQSAVVALRTMLARNVPLSIALNAIYQYAKQPGSWWAPAASWYTPPNQRKGSESPGLTRGG